MDTRKSSSAPRSSSSPPGVDAGGEQFRFVALPAERFEPLWSASDEELRARGARRMVVDAHPGYPCRVSLEDAAIGETVILLPFAHHDVDSPYRASGPIFVRRTAATAAPAPGEIPPVVRRRMVSLRAYDGEGAMRSSAVAEGEADIAAAIRRLFGDPEVAEIHVHNAKPGCFSSRVVRG